MHSLTSKFFLSIIDQAILALASFFVSLLLVRHAAPAHYGIYVIATAVLVWLRDISGCLVGGPLIFLVPVRDQADRSAFIARMGMLQVLLSITSVAACLAAALVCTIASASPELAQSFFILGVAAPFILFQEFARRAFIAQLKMGRALLCDAVYAGFLVALVLMLSSLLVSTGEWSLDGRYVIACMGFSAALSSIITAFQLRRLLPHCHIRLWETLREAWNFGRWGLLGIGLSTVHIQGVYFLLATFAGLEAVARFDGPRLLLVPPMQLLTAWGFVIGPMSAHIYRSKGLDIALRFIFKASLPLLAFVILYLFGLMLAPAELISWVLGSKLSIEPSVVLFWGGVTITMVLGTCIGSIFNPMGRPDLGTRSRAVAMILTLLLAIPLILHYGESGAAASRFASEIGMAIINLISAVMLIWKIKGGTSERN